MRKIQEEWDRFRQSLKEAANTNIENYAIFLQKFGNSWNFYLYDYRKFAANFLEDDAGSGPGWENFVVGMIEVGVSRSISDQTPCFSYSGAKVFEVDRSVALDKTGPLLYDLALVFAVQTGGVGLMSGRETVKPEAQAVYSRWFQSRKGATGIDISVLKMDAPPPNNRTETSLDDCELHPEESFDPSVNYVYRTNSKIGILETMVEKHKKVVKIVSEKTNIPAGELEMEIVDSGDNLFSSKFYEGEDYQTKIKRGYEKKKRELIGLGGNRATNDIYQIKRAFYKRSKSGPPGYSGS